MLWQSAPSHLLFRIFEYSIFQHLKYIYELYVGESGVVYKGYIDTSLGSELVAVKTGKGIKNCAGIDCVKTCMCMYPLICSPIFLW